MLLILICSHFHNHMKMKKFSFFMIVIMTMVLTLWLTHAVCYDHKYDCNNDIIWTRQYCLLNRWNRANYWYWLGLHVALWTDDIFSSFDVQTSWKRQDQFIFYFVQSFFFLVVVVVGKQVEEWKLSHVLAWHSKQLIYKQSLMRANQITVQVFWTAFSLNWINNHCNNNYL